jgi:prepilin-type N-terminal cleavage/methylation domain-containing protein
MPARCVVPAAARRGFTIVELLVVVGIISVLAALITPAVIRARSAAKNAAIKTEIDMLHMAVMNYKNEYGSFPPCSGDLTAAGRSGKHIARIFPRCTNVVSQLGSTPVNPGLALVAWLDGYTSDPINPKTGTGGRKPLYDFDQARVNSFTYAPADKPSSPFVYIDASGYGASANSPTVYGVVVGASTVDYSAQTHVLASGTAFFNPNTFQILCAGQDGIWGNDDDLSNFWTGTRVQHNSRNQ